MDGRDHAGRHVVATVTPVRGECHILDPALGVAVVEHLAGESVLSDGGLTEQPGVEIRTNMEMPLAANIWIG